MPEPSKFSGALAKLNQPTTKEPTEAPVEQPPAPPVPQPAAKRGRPVGKRSNPDYEPTTILLRKQTKKLAHRKLEDRESGDDLSDLIEKLLSEWIKT